MLSNEASNLSLFEFCSKKEKGEREEEKVTIMKGSLVIRSRPGVGQFQNVIRWEEEDKDETQNEKEDETKDTNMMMVQVHVEAVGVNVDDIHLAEGTMILPISAKVDEKVGVIPGIELSGTIISVEQGQQHEPRKVVGIKPCFYQTRGTWTSSVCFMKELWLANVPSHLSLLEAAALPITSCAALSCLRQSGLLVNGKNNPKKKRNDNVLQFDDNLSGRTGGTQLVQPAVVIVGASGGIGTILVQMLVRASSYSSTVDPKQQQRLYGRKSNLKVIAVSSSKSSDVCLKKCGAHEWIDRTNPKAVKELVEEIKSRQNIDCKVVFDLVGGLDIENTYYPVLDKTATYVTMNGPREWIGDGDTLPTLRGTFMYMMSLLWRLIGWNYICWWGSLRGAKYAKADVPPTDAVGDLLRDAMLVVDQLKIKPVIDSVVDPKDSKALTTAIHKVRSHQSRGKVVLQFKSKQTSIVGRTMYQGTMTKYN